MQLVAVLTGPGLLRAPTSLVAIYTHFLCVVAPRYVRTVVVFERDGTGRLEIWLGDRRRVRQFAISLEHWFFNVEQFIAVVQHAMQRV